MFETNAGPMYCMKPVFTLPEKLPRTKVMYEMTNIHDCRIATKIEQQKPHPELTALELRQEKILGQLAEIKKIIASLTVMVKSTDETEMTTINKNEETEKVAVVADPVTINLVLKVNRTQIPYSLLALKKIWTDTCFNVSCHSHSDVTDSKPTDEITSFQKLLQSDKQAQPNKHTVNLTLIWKNVDTMEVNLGIGHTMLGESSLLRFLSRKIANHNYETEFSIEQQSAVDTILDECYETRLGNCDKAFNASVTRFDNALKSGNTWLVSKSEPSIADIAAWSVIKSRSVKKLPTNVAKWFDRCQKQFCC